MSMSDTFLLSNIVPQNYKNNSDYWNRLELYCRDIAHKYANVWVTSGPAFVPQTGEDDKKFIFYQVQLTARDELFVELFHKCFR